MIKICRLAAVLTIMGILFSAPAFSVDQTDGLYTRRFALLVGANDGGRERTTLRYAVADARALRHVMEEMGGIQPEDTRFLADPDRAAFFREFKALTEDVARAKLQFRRVEVIFFYSGHSDEESLYLGNDRVTYNEFRDLITEMKADVRIAIIDSCASGALTLPKGVIKRTPFLMDTAYDMKGYAFMTSSSANEAAQESSRLKRSFFTHNLLSGMRGAADMNRDGRITLNEAYQFAFEGTLRQTQKTMAGPQHPSYHIQMSGTGDVIITEIWKSNAVLVLDKDLAGKIYIHNEDNMLVVEMNKAGGKDVSIGLDAGRYRVINIDGDKICESRVTLVEGKSVTLGAARFSGVNKIPTQLRGQIYRPFSKRRVKMVGKRWRLELSGGYGFIDPADLNLRVTHDEMFDQFYRDDYTRYLFNNGYIQSYSTSTEGGKINMLKHGLPFEFRLRYALNSWLDLSLGISYLSGSRSSNNKTTINSIELDGSPTVYSDEYKDYTLKTSGFIPSIGFHLGKNLNRFLRLETFVFAGPLFGSCSYSMVYNSQFSGPMYSGGLENPDGLLEEKGKGVGVSLRTGIRMDYKLSETTGWFAEGSYAYQNVESLSGPGLGSSAARRDQWEGEWGIKQDIKQTVWGTARFLWPSNGWDIFDGTWWKTRNFELNLSGFQLRFGLFFRF